MIKTLSVKNWWVVVGIFALLLICYSLFYLIIVNKKDGKNTKQIQAAVDSVSLSSEANWNEGSVDNIKTNDPSGTVKIDDVLLGDIVVSGAGDSSYNGTYIEQIGAWVTLPSYTNGTRWLLDGVMGPGWWLCQNDTPNPDDIDIRYYSTGTSLPGNPWTQTKADYIPPPTVIMDVSATHTTGATQIDGTENFWSWEGFTPTDSKPANTSITYRYRTSTDGATWTSWVSDIGSVTSRTGDDSDSPTLYRYLQVEATLSNTDGASTPTIDAYDIDYHTEVKPSKPTAQTAVAQ
ncbi:MAG: hypothetical protein ABIJ72_02040 [bacterium]